MQFRMKIRAKNGQNVLEYSLLIVVIVIGIMVMGPYVIKSWNAHMKGWEDSVTDTMYDPLTQASP